jgi:outer membrane protein OmpA-like peptidoglycan-associated protein
MKKLKTMVVLNAMLLLQVPVYAVETPATVPLYKVTIVQSSAQAINYRYLKSSTMIDFKGTVLLAGAKGSAEVKSKAGATEIDAEFENLPAATQFGAAYLTYVLWAISPEGRSSNLGELIVNKGKSELKVTEQLQTFGLIVTAEPYFAVSAPSNIVVMENAIRKDTKGKISTINAKYELLERGQYEVNITPNELGMKMDSKTPLAVYQARNAVRIAKAAGAETLAPEAFATAQQLLAESETKEGGKKGRSATAREAVQRAEDARSVSVKRQQANALTAERQQSKDQITQAQGAATTAALGQAQAETAKAQAELAQGKADADRNAALHQVQRVETEKSVLRAQLLQQLNSILQTSDSARGLIVNMSGVLFQTGKSELTTPAREKLAKISGIVLSHPGLKLEIEGHTDSVGQDASNQALSQRRAQSARDYLVSQGVSADSIVSRGFGSSQPIASNDTTEGRQSNRRVELVVTGDAIQVSMKTPSQQ